MRRVQRGRAIARSSKNIFRSYLSDRLSFISYKFDFFLFLKNERGVRGEFHFSKFLNLILLRLLF
ncbi:MAG: hypothetical protein U9R00_01490, partial [Patescibacteria group bacterium]|nr:hypothetical protein [Patescibacteria group bacterium]